MTNEPTSKVQPNDIQSIQGKELIRLKRSSTYSSASIAKAICLLDLPQLYHYCSICSKHIGRHAAKESCSKCHKIFHIKCFPSLRALNRNCGFCSNQYQCSVCKQEIVHCEDNVSCTICHSEIHPKCYEFPLQLFNYSKKLFSQIYERQVGLQKRVCQKCFQFWGENRLFQAININNIRYGLYRVNHLSPIHFTWKTIAHSNDMDVEQQAPQEEQYLTRIENIFSIGCTNPSKCQRVTLQQLFLHMSKESVKQGKVKSPYKFLVKWEEDTRLVWQDEQVIKPHKRLLKNFFNGLLLNIMLKSEQMEKKEALMAQRIDLLVEKEGIANIVSFIDSNTSQNSDKVEQKVYELYKKREKQCIKARRSDDPYRMEIICKLINQIYFKLKNINPVFIFTEILRIDWWMLSLREYCPFHSLLRIYGPEDYVSELLDFDCFLKRGGQNTASKFNIFLFDAEIIHLVISRLSLYDLIDSKASLLVIDNSLNSAANHFYQKVSIPRIKLTTKRVIENTSSDIRVTRTESKPSLSAHQFSVVESSQAKKYWDDRIPALTESRMRVQWVKIKSCFQSNEYEKQMILDVIQRMVFLRYIMLFGLTGQSWTHIVLKISRLQPQFFSQWNINQSRNPLSIYFESFLSVLHHLSQEKTESYSKIQQFYFFHLEPTQIIRRINFISRLKTYCQSQQAYVQPQKQIQAFLVDSDDLKICKAILDRGFGRWEAICDYTKIWQLGFPKQSLRHYLCSKAQIQLLPTETFTRLIEKRIMTILKENVINASCSI